jgi:hypothetical protein
MGRNKNSMKKKSESLPLADKEAGMKKTILGIDVPVRDFMKRLRHKVANKYSESTKKFYNKTNQSFLEKEIKNRKDTRLASYRPVLDLPCSHLPHGSESLNHRKL